MLRFLCLCLCLALAGTGLAQSPGPLPQQRQVAEAVWQIMRMESLARVMRDEAIAEAEEMAAGMFPGGGSGRWLDRVGAIHHPARFRALFMAGMADAMTGRPADDMLAGLAFYRTALGQRILTLETSARVAMLDAEVEAGARAAFRSALARRDPRAGRILRLIRTADLIEPNVAGGLNAAIAFSSGFQEGGGLPVPLSRDQMIREAWAQEAQLRAETEAWMTAYLFLAYAVLGDAELDRYIAYAGSAGGAALAQLMFAGFDAVLAQTSRDMGLAAAAEMRARQL